MRAKSKKKLGKIISYIILITIGILMCYPLIWMFFASFKTNTEIFAGVRLLGIVQL